MARRIARDEGGHTLVELMIAMTMLIGILSATLLTFERFERGNRQTADRTEATDTARTQLSLLSRQLRNLASPTDMQPNAIDLAEADDIVFKTVDPDGPPPGSNRTNVRRVRFCVGPGGRNGTQRLVKQEQTWDTELVPAAHPSTDTCPGPWGNQQVLAENVVNGARRAFTYLPAGAATSSITNLGATLYVDTNPADGVRETRIQSGVYLRNQNRAPIARFTASPTGNGRVILNGSISEDPEGDPLDYEWFAEVGGVTKRIGRDVTCDCPSEENLAALSPGTYTMWLEVFDSGELRGVSATQQVVIR